jgi:DNA gyrase inhibitor GyrI
MGPYDQVAPTYEKLYKWIAENKYEPAGPMIEWYLSDPSQVKPESLQAKIGAVIKPMAAPADTTMKAGEPKKEEPKTETPTGS